MTPDFERKFDIVFYLILTILTSVTLGIFIGVEWYDGKYRPGIEKYLQECQKGSAHASDDR